MRLAALLLVVVLSTMAELKRYTLVVEADELHGQRTRVRFEVLDDDETAGNRAYTWWNFRRTAAVAMILCLALFGNRLNVPEENATLSNGPSFKTLTNTAQRDFVYLQIVFTPGVNEPERDQLVRDIAGRIVGEAELNGVARGAGIGLGYQSPCVYRRVRQPPPGSAAGRA